MQKLAILSEQVENEALKLKELLENQFANKEAIIEKGKKDRAYAAEVLAEIQMLANQRENLKASYDQLKSSMQNTKGYALENARLLEKLTQVEEFSSNFGDPSEMVKLINNAKSNLESAQESSEHAASVLEDLNKAFFFAISHELQTKINTNNQTIQSVNDAIEEIETQITSLEEQKCDENSLIEVTHSKEEIK